MKPLQVLSLVISISALILSLVSLGRTIYKTAYREGFNACIEEREKE